MMDGRAESVYNLIPQPTVEIVKDARYRSKHDPRLRPAGTTFGVSGTTALPGANLNSDPARVVVGKGQHRTSGQNATFGKALGSMRPDPNQYLAKKSFEDPRKNKAEKFNRQLITEKRPPIPSRKDAPVMGLQSTKNYVTSNAVEAILAVPGYRARVQEQQPVYRTKVDYGQVPSYLTDVKAEIDRENDMIESYIRAQEPQNEVNGQTGEEISQEERDELVDALKTKWDAVNARYQKICHIVKLDTIGKVRRKEAMEAELTQLEKDIERLEGRRVVVVDPSDA